MSDPRVKAIKFFKRQEKAFKLIRQGLQLMNWGLVKLDADVFIAGKKEMVLYVQEIVNAEIKPTARETRETGSLELLAVREDNNQSPPLEARHEAKEGDIAAIKTSNSTTG